MTFFFGFLLYRSHRHYLDFIHHFVKLYSEKRSDLEEQQLHLNVGLNKIAETLEQVEEMQKSLAVKSQELQAKNEMANAKLKQMFKDQQEAEKKKIQSQDIQIKLAEQTIKIEEKRKYVMADLAQVEPAVLDAQQGKTRFFILLHVLCSCVCVCMEVYLDFCWLNDHLLFLTKKKIISSL